MRRQPICLAIENRQIEPLLLEIFVSIGELGRAVMPGVDIAADRWLRGPAKAMPLVTAEEVALVEA